MKLLTPEAQHREQITNLANVFTRVDRVLSGRGDVKCVAEMSGSNAPAWSDGKTITFNVNRIQNITNVEDIVMITGLNYHELAHVLFTPRENHVVGEFVRSNGFQTAFNILEDQRIETLLTAQYPATAAYFTTTFMRYCLAREEQWESNHALAYGRRYLPRKVREAFGERFKWQQYRKDFERVIDGYRLLNPHKKTHAKKMNTLIRKFDGLLNLINTPDQPYGHGQGRPEVPQRGKEATSNQQDEAAEWAEWYDDDRDEAEAAEDEEKQRTDKGRDSDNKDDADDDDQGDSDDDGDSGDASDGDDSEADAPDDAGASDSDSDDGDDAEGESSGDGSDGDDGAEDGDDGEGSGDGGSDNPGSEGDGDAGSDDVGSGDDPFGQGDGTGEGSSGASGQRHIDDDHELRGIIEDEMNGILNDAEVQREAIAKQTQIINGTGHALPQLSTKRASYKQPSAQMVNITQKFGKELERLRDDLDPGWHRHKSSGRINVQRAIQGADLDTVWDQWEEGINDSTDFEAVLYVDYSGSMSGVEMVRACESMWIIKRAIERVGGSVTVYAFDDESSILYRPDQKALANEVKMIQADGFTDPTEAVRDSLRIFQQSKRKNKIAIFLTDGGWGGGQHGVDGWPDMIKRMNAFGIVTALAVIGGYGMDYTTPAGRRYTQMAQSIDNAGDLIGFAKAIVKQVMKESRR